MEVTLEALQNAWKQATESEKRMLANLFGEDNCRPKDITERVKSYEDACALLGEAPITDSFVLPHDLYGDFAASLAFRKLATIARALNEGWQPDWSNHGQYKYYPWFKADASGSGLSFLGYGSWYSYTTVGSRLAYKSPELAAYAGRQFNDLYNQFLTIK